MADIPESLVKAREQKTVWNFEQVLQYLRTKHLDYLSPKFICSKLAMEIKKMKEVNDEETNEKLKAFDLIINEYTKTNELIINKFEEQQKIIDSQAKEIENLKMMFNKLLFQSMEPGQEDFKESFIIVQSSKPDKNKVESIMTAMKGEIDKSILVASDKINNDL
jgi:hypothetical protein